MGKLIILFLVAIAIVVIWQLLIIADKKKLDKIKADNANTKDKTSVNALIDLINHKIKAIEKDSTLNAVDAEAKLKFHKEELNKLEALKNKLS